MEKKVVFISLPMSGLSEACTMYGIPVITMDHEVKQEGFTKEV